MANVDIFQQLHDFFQYFNDIFGQGIKSVSEIPELIRKSSEYISSFMSCVHPAFASLLGFAIAVSLLFKLLRIDGIH